MFHAVDAIAGATIVRIVSGVDKNKMAALRLCENLDFGVVRIGSDRFKCGSTVEGTMMILRDYNIEGCDVARHRLACRSANDTSCQIAVKIQCDPLLRADIVSRQYHDDGFMLGQRYPGLCASIFLLGERGQ